MKNKKSKLVNYFKYHLKTFTMSDMDSLQSECEIPDCITWNGKTIYRTNIKMDCDKICIFNTKCTNSRCPYVHLSYSEVDGLKNYILNDLKDDLGIKINPNTYIPVSVFNNLKNHKEKNSISKVSTSTRSNSCSVISPSTSSSCIEAATNAASKHGRQSEEFVEILNIMIRLKNDHRGWKSLKSWVSNYIQEEYSPESKMYEHLLNLQKISEK
tara:strand:- start:63 stop:701 length:639 start_codon:yes stop_codon:yes gene_type:complete